MILALFTVGLVAAGLTIGLIVTATAPLGYEDDTGFHFGEQRREGTMSRYSRHSPVGARLKQRLA
jgi:hypothetical protein